MRKLASEWVDNTPFATKEIENNANVKFWSDNKEYHGIFEKGLLPWELLQACLWINLKVPGKKHTNFPNFSVDNKSEESWGKLVASTRTILTRNIWLLSDIDHHYQFDKTNEYAKTTIACFAPARHD